MSIILDALKKAESSKTGGESQDTSIKDTQSEGPASGVFKPVKKDVATASNSNKSKIILVSVLAVLVLGIVIFYSYTPSVSSLFSKPDTETMSALPKIPLKKNKVVSQNKGVKKSNKIREKNLKKALKLKKEASDYFQDQKYDKAVYVYKQLIDLVPTDHEVYNNYGVALKNNGKPKEAKKAYHTALALNPDYTEALNNLAVIEISERRYNEAKRRLEKTIQIRPDYMDPYLHLAICLEKTGDIKTAIQYYKSFLNMSEGKINRKIRLQIENRVARLQEEL